MSQSRPTDPLEGTPGSVRLGLCALLAGLAGRPVTLVFRDFPPDVTVGVWNFLAGLLPDERVLELGSPRDLSVLRRELAKIRLVLVYPMARPGLLTAVAWLLERRRGRRVPLPAVLSAVAAEPGEAPGASLVVHGRPEELGAIAGWLGGADRSLDEPLRSFLRRERESLLGITFVPELVDALLQRPAPADGGPGPKAAQTSALLAGLLAGACCLRQLAAGDAAWPTTLQASVQDYGTIYRLLRGPTTRPAADPYDPLAEAMVRRANAYLQMKATAAGPGPSRSGKVARAEQAGQAAPEEETSVSDRITRRMLADLGNVRSGEVRWLVDHLRRASNGIAKFRKIGLVRPLPQDADWPSEDPTELCRQLLPWSIKQVRVHFGRLHEQGLIEAQRPQANGPWVYRLPEELTTPASAFRDLPKPEDLRSGAVAAGGGGT
jgi:hypothetical protein